MVSEPKASRSIRCPGRLSAALPGQHRAVHLRRINGRSCGLMQLHRGKSRLIREIQFLDQIWVTVSIGVLCVAFWRFNESLCFAALISETVSCGGSNPSRSKIADSLFGAISSDCFEGSSSSYRLRSVEYQIDQYTWIKFQGEAKAAIQIHYVHVKQFTRLIEASIGRLIEDQVPRQVLNMRFVLVWYCYLTWRSINCILIF